MIIPILAQAPDYSYHVPWFIKYKLGMAVLLGLFAVGKALRSGMASSPRSTRSVQSSWSEKPVEHAQIATPPIQPVAPPVAAPSVPPILILKGEQQLGPFTLEEVNAHLSAGAFALTDLAWHEGLAEWQPLISIVGGMATHAHGLRPPPPPVHATGSSSPTGNPPAPSPNGLLVSGYICAAVSLLFLPPVLGLAGIICGVILIKRQQANQGVILLIISFVCAVIGMIIGAAS